MLVLGSAKIPAALSVRVRGVSLPPSGPAPAASQDCLPEIIDLLRVKTSHDFKLYKSGTLQRRIGRRTAEASIESGDMARCLARASRRADAAPARGHGSRAAGHPSKIIAADFGISQRTVENLRASIMLKTGCKSMPAFARLALAAAETE